MPATTISVSASAATTRAAAASSQDGNGDRYTCSRVPAANGRRCQPGRPAWGPAQNILSGVDAAGLQLSVTAAQIGGDARGQGAVGGIDVWAMSHYGADRRPRVGACVARQSTGWSRPLPTLKTQAPGTARARPQPRDRKSTRLN